MHTKKRSLLKLVAWTLCGTLLSQELHAAPLAAASAPAPEALQRSLLADPASLAVPLEFAQLSELEKGSQGTLILHIQDAHSNTSGQQNLAATLDSLMAKYGIRLVLSEGGEGDCSLTSLRKIASPATWKRVAKTFLLSGEVQGEEYLNLTSEHPMKIIGIEDMGLYGKSLDSYAALADKREQALVHLDRIERALGKLKNKLYPKELKDYEALREKEDFEPAFKKYLALASVTDTGGQIARMAAVLGEEGGVRFELANLERAVLLDELRQKGRGEALEDYLAKEKGKLKTKAAIQAHFQRTLNIARENGIDIARFENLSAYLAYLAAFSAVDMDALLDEWETGEEKVYEERLEADARTVHAVDRFVRHLRAAHEIRMTTPEHDRFKSDEPSFPVYAMEGFLNRKLAEHGYFDDLVPADMTLDEAREAIDAFYDSVTERDRAFIANLERSMAAEGEKVAFLITGGYHTPHLKKLMKEKGHGYAVLTPLVTGETNRKKYEKLILSQRQSDTLRAMLVAAEGNGARMAKLAAAAESPSGARLAGSGVKARPDVLAYLQKQDKPVTVNQIVNGTGWGDTAVINALKSLEVDGLVDVTKGRNSCGLRTKYYQISGEDEGTSGARLADRKMERLTEGVLSRLNDAKADMTKSLNKARSAAKKQFWQHRLKELEGFLETVSSGLEGEDLEAFAEELVSEAEILKSQVMLWSYPARMYEESAALMREYLEKSAGARLGVLTKLTLFSVMAVTVLSGLVFWWQQMPVVYALLYGTVTAPAMYGTFLLHEIAHWSVAWIINILNLGKVFAKISLRPIKLRTVIWTRAPYVISSILVPVYIAGPVMTFGLGTGLTLFGVYMLLGGWPGLGVLAVVVGLAQFWVLFKVPGTDWEDIKEIRRGGARLASQNATEAIEEIGLALDQMREFSPSAFHETIRGARQLQDILRGDSWSGAVSDTVSLMSSLTLERYIKYLESLGNIDPAKIANLRAAQTHFDRAAALIKGGSGSRLAGLETRVARNFTVTATFVSVVTGGAYLVQPAYAVALLWVAFIAGFIGLMLAGRGDSGEIWASRAAGLALPPVLVAVSLIHGGFIATLLLFVVGVLLRQSVTRGKKDGPSGARLAGSQTTSVRWVGFRAVLGAVLILSGWAWNLIVQDDLGVFGGPLLSAAPWVLYHLGDLFDAIGYPMLAFVLIRILSWVDSLGHPRSPRDFRNDRLILAAVLLAFTVPLFFYEVIHQGDLIDFLVELVGFSLVWLLNEIPLRIEQRAGSGRAPTGARLAQDKPYGSVTMPPRKLSGPKDVDDLFSQIGYGSDETAKVFGDVQAMIDGETLRVLIIRGTTGYGSNVEILTFKPLGGGYYSIVAHAGANYQNGTISEPSTATHVTGKGYMQKTITLLLLRNVISTWESDERIEPPAHRMYARMKRDPRLRVRDRSYGGYTVTANAPLNLRELVLAGLGLGLSLIYASGSSGLLSVLAFAAYPLLVFGSFFFPFQALLALMDRPDEERGTLSYVMDVALQIALAGLALYFSVALKPFFPQEIITASFAILVTVFMIRSIFTGAESLMSHRAWYVLPLFGLGGLVFYGWFASYGLMFFSSNTLLAALGTSWQAFYALLTASFGLALARGAYQIGRKGRKDPTFLVSMVVWAVGFYFAGSMQGGLALLLAGSAAQTAAFLFTGYLLAAAWQLAGWFSYRALEIPVSGPLGLYRRLASVASGARLARSPESELFDSLGIRTQRILRSDIYTGQDHPITAVLHDADDPKQGMDYLRVGRVVIAVRSMRQAVEQAGFPEGTVRVYLDEPFAYGAYAAPMIALMQEPEMNLRGKTVVDMGSGSGILSLVALALGAEKVLAIEMDEGLAMQARNALVRAGLKGQHLRKGESVPTGLLGGDERFAVYQGDMRDWFSVANPKDTIGTERYVVLANVGRYSDYSVYSELRDFVRDNPGVEAAVMGGYREHGNTGLAEDPSLFIEARWALKTAHLEMMSPYAFSAFMVHRPSGARLASLKDLKMRFSIQGVRSHYKDEGLRSDSEVEVLTDVRRFGMRVLITDFTDEDSSRKNVLVFQRRFGFLWYRLVAYASISINEEDGSSSAPDLRVIEDGRGFMRRAIKLLLLSGEISEWHSGLEMSRSARAMYRAMKEDPQLEVEGSDDSGYTVTAVARGARLSHSGRPLVLVSLAAVAAVVTDILTKVWAQAVLPMALDPANVWLMIGEVIVAPVLVYHVGSPALLAQLSLQLAVMLVLSFFWIRKMGGSATAMTGLGLLLGGSASNVGELWLTGRATDWLFIALFKHTVYNLADLLLYGGTVLVILAALRFALARLRAGTRSPDTSTVGSRLAQADALNALSESELEAKLRDALEKGLFPVFLVDADQVGYAAVVVLRKIDGEWKMLFRIAETDEEEGTSGFTFMVPAGKLEKSEKKDADKPGAIRRAARRELAEESGLIIEDAALIGPIGDFRDKKKSHLRLFVHVDRTGKEPVDALVKADFVWVPLGPYLSARGEEAGSKVLEHLTGRILEKRPGTADRKGEYRIRKSLANEGLGRFFEWMSAASGARLAGLFGTDAKAEKVAALGIQLRKALFERFEDDIRRIPQAEYGQGADDFMRRLEAAGLAGPDAAGASYLGHGKEVIAFELPQYPGLVFKIHRDIISEKNGDRVALARSTMTRLLRNAGRSNAVYARRVAGRWKLNGIRDLIVPTAFVKTKSGFLMIQQKGTIDGDSGADDVDRYSRSLAAFGATLIDPNIRRNAVLLPDGTRALADIGGIQVSGARLSALQALRALSQVEGPVFEYEFGPADTDTKPFQKAMNAFVAGIPVRFADGDEARWLQIALRETLKNAYDAVVSRNQASGGQHGSIRVRFILDVDAGQVAIEVTDDGAGTRSATTEQKIAANSIPGRLNIYFGGQGRGMKLSVPPAGRMTMELAGRERGENEGSLVRFDLPLSGFSLLSADRTPGARLAKEAFVGYFGTHAAEVLEFVTGEDILDSVEEHESVTVRETTTQKHTVRLKGSTRSYVFFTKPHDPEHGLSDESLQVLSREAVGPEARVFDYEDGSLLVMRTLAGRSLEGVKLTPEIIKAIAFALGKLHRLGVVHGDLWSGGPGTLPRSLHRDNMRLAGESIGFLDYEHAVRVEGGKDSPEAVAEMQGLLETLQNMRSVRDDIRAIFREEYARGYASIALSGARLAAAELVGGDKNLAYLASVRASLDGPVGTVLVPGSGADISTVLLATDAERVLMVDKLPFIPIKGPKLVAMSHLRRQYLEEKKDQGFAQISTLSVAHNLYPFLMDELYGLGAESIRVESIGDRAHRVLFTWNGRQREVLFFDSAEADPGAIDEVLARVNGAADGLNVLFMKAGMYGSFGGVKHDDLILHASKTWFKGKPSAFVLSDQEPGHDLLGVLSPIHPENPDRVDIGYSLIYPTGQGMFVYAHRTGARLAGKANPSSRRQKLKSRLAVDNPYRDDGLWTFPDLVYALGQTEEFIRRDLAGLGMSGTPRMVRDEADDSEELVISQPSFKSLGVSGWTARAAEINGEIAAAAMRFAFRNDNRGASELTIRGVTFLRRRKANQTVWVIRRNDLPALDAAFGLGLLPAAGPGDVMLSRNGLTDQGITNADSVSLWINAAIADAVYAHQLANPKSAEPTTLTVGGVDVYKVYSGNQPVWAFKKASDAAETPRLVEQMLAAAPKWPQNSFVQEMVSEFQALAGSESALGPAGIPAYNHLRQAVGRAVRVHGTREAARRDIMLMIRRASYKKPNELVGFFDEFQFPAGARLADTFTAKAGLPVEVNGRPLSFRLLGQHDIGHGAYSVVRVVAGKEPSLVLQWLADIETGRTPDNSPEAKAARELEEDFVAHVDIERDRRLYGGATAFEPGRREKVEALGFTWEEFNRVLELSLDWVRRVQNGETVSWEVPVRQDAAGARLADRDISETVLSDPKALYATLYPDAPSIPAALSLFADIKKDELRIIILKTSRDAALVLVFDPAQSPSGSYRWAAEAVVGLKGRVMSDGSTEAFIDGQGYMRRAIRVLLVTNSIDQWDSHGRVLSDNARKMYEGLKQHPDLTVVERPNGALSVTRSGSRMAESDRLFDEMVKLRDSLRASDKKRLMAGVPMGDFADKARALSTSDVRYLSHGVEVIVFTSDRHPGFVFKIRKNGDHSEAAAYAQQQKDKLESMLRFGGKRLDESMVRFGDWDLIEVPGVAWTAFSADGLIIQEAGTQTEFDGQPVSGDDETLFVDGEETTRKRVELRRLIESQGAVYFEAAHYNDIYVRGKLVVSDLGAIVLAADVRRGSRLSATVLAGPISAQDRKLLAGFANARGVRLVHSPAMFFAFDGGVAQVVPMGGMAVGIDPVGGGARLAVLDLKADVENLRFTVEEGAEPAQDLAAQMELEDFNKGLRAVVQAYLRFEGALPANYHADKTVEFRMITEEALPAERRAVLEAWTQAVQKAAGGNIFIRFGTSQADFKSLPGSDDKESYSIVYLGEISDSLLAMAQGHGIAATPEGSLDAEHQPNFIGQLLFSALVQRLDAPVESLQQMWSNLRASPVDLGPANFALLREVRSGASALDYRNLTFRVHPVPWQAVLSGARLALQALGQSA